MYFQPRIEQSAHLAGRPVRHEGQSVRGSKAARLLQWLVVAVLFGVLFKTQSASSFNAQPSLWLFSVSILACGLLVSTIPTISAKNIWVWTFLYVFLNAYYVKGSWLTARLESSPSQVAVAMPDLLRVTPEMVAKGQAWITASFVAFALASWWILQAQAQRPLVRPKAARSPMPTRVVHVVLITFIIYLGASALQHALGFGTLGTTPSGNPISTVITRFRNDIVPAIFLLCYWLQRQYGSSRSTLTLTLVVICGIVESFISTSRGGLFRYLLPFGFLWLVTHELRARRVVFSAIVGGVALLLIPFVSDLRSARLGASSTNPKVETALTPDRLANSALFFLFRIPGADGVWLSVNYAPSTFSPDRTLAILKAGSNRDIFTQDVVGLNRPGDYRAPGIVAAFMLIGGIPIVAGLMASLAVLCAAISRRIESYQIAPVALGLFNAGLFSAIGDGGFYLASIIAVPIVIATCHFVYRFALTTPIHVGRSNGETIRASQLSPL